MEISLIRHFKTQGNVERRYIGSTDESIIISEVTEKMRGRYPETGMIVSSPMKRCLQTTRCIYDRMPDLVCEEFREKDFGRYEGKNYEDLKEEPSYRTWLDSGGKLPFPEGEEQECFQRRNTEGFENVMKRLIEQNCQKAAFVVHGGTIMSILSAYAEQKRSFYDWQIENGNGYWMWIDETAWKSGRKKITEIEKLW